MTRRFISAGEGLPRWKVPISHAVVVGKTCYVSGQLSVAEDGTFVPGTVEEEPERAFTNVFAALRAAEFTREEIVFVDLDFADLGDLAKVNAIFARLFPEGRRPARTVSQSAALPYGGKIKVVAVAQKD